MLKKISSQIILICKTKLLELKRDLLNRVKNEKSNFVVMEKTGDESDQASVAMAENNFLVSQERLRFQLSEIEFALSRIESGTFGVCEETEELIEEDRLLTLPWTRLSIEGAEMREELNKRHARR